MIEDRLLKRKEVMFILSIKSLNTLKKLEKEGTLKPWGLLGGDVRYLESTVNNFINKKS